MNTNKGHRERVRNRFLKEGLDSFEEVHALELLLFYAIPQKNTKPIARALLDRFGTLPLVMEATMEDLMTVPGVGPGVAAYLKLITAAGRYYQTHKDSGRKILNSTRKCGEYLISRFYGMRNETAFLLCLDAKCELLHCAMLTEGDVTSANISVRRIAEIALSVNAVSVVLAHNHPSGFALPSDEDVLVTQRVSRALSMLGIILADHIVVSGNDFVSMVESRLYAVPNL